MSLPPLFIATAIARWPSRQLYTLGIACWNGAHIGNERVWAMNGDGGKRDELEQTEQEILTPQEQEILTLEISDEALEAAAGVPGYPNVTERFTSFITNNCLLC